MPVIAMNQEMGSQGKFVAEKLAEELGLDIVRHEIMQHVAEKMHMRKSTLQRFLEGKARIRVQLSAAHSREDLQLALTAFGQAKRELGV